MARDALVVQQMGNEGAQYDQAIAYTEMVAANDLEFANDGRTLLLVKNGGTTGAGAATIVSVAAERGRTGDIAISIAQGADGIFGPFPVSAWNQAGAVVHVDSAFEDAFSFAAIRLPQMMIG